MTLFLLIGVTLCAACVALVGRAFALPRIRALDRIGQIDAYGFTAESGTEPAAAPGAVTGLVGHIVKGVGGFFARHIQGLSEADVRRELMAAGMYRTAPTTLIGYRVICAIALPMTVLWMVSASGGGGPLLVVAVPLMLLLGWRAPLIVVQRRARERLQRIDQELPELVDLLVVTVESGLGFASSMQLAAERLEGPLGDEMRLAMQEQAMGLTTDQVLGNMVARSDTPSMHSFVRSVRQGESLGVSIGQILRNLASEMRKRRRAAAEERAQKAPIKILFPLAFLIFPALFVVLLSPAIIKFVESMSGGS